MVPRKGMKMGTGCGRRSKPCPKPWLPPQLLAESPRLPSVTGLVLGLGRPSAGRRPASQETCRRLHRLPSVGVCRRCGLPLRRCHECVAARDEQAGRHLERSFCHRLTSLYIPAGTDQGACLPVRTREAADAVSTVSRRYGVFGVPSKAPPPRTSVNSRPVRGQPGRDPLAIRAPPN
jgi:hypothetical protein